MTIKKVSLTELSKTDNAKLFKTVDLISLDKKGEHSKIVYDSKNKFYFDDANGKEIESADGHKSFTFQIYTNDSLAKIENVLFTEKGNGEYDAYRVKYDFTEKELATLSKEQLSKKKVEYTYITSSKPNKTSKASYNCLEISEWISYPAYEGDLRGEFRNDGEWVTIAVVCGKTNTEIQPGTDNSTSNSGWSTGNFNSTSSGSTNGNTTAGGVYTSPVVSPGLQFVNSLNFDTKDNILILSNEAQKIVFDYLTANGFSETSKARAKYVLDRFNFSWIGEQTAGTDVALFNYLSQNGFSSESGSFVNLVVNQMAQSPNLIFDINASLKSPFNIDRSAINNATPEGQKFNSIYKALEDSPEFKKLFIDLFGSNSRFNVKFVIGSIVGSANGNTNTDLNNPTLNTITISPAFLNSSNKMEIAKTIIHECIHAYLNVKLCDAGQGISIPTLNNLDYYNVINQKYNGFNGSQEQHNFIYTYMLPILENILSEVKDTLVSTADNATMNGLTMHIPIGTIGTPFTWTDFFHNLALSGLQSCSFFKNEIGTFDSTGTPIIIINQSLMDAYNQYNNFGELYLHP